jgi:Ser/Thr protein kinase RdoA (MazF antagonist)
VCPPGPSIPFASALAVARRWDDGARDVAHVRTGQNETWAFASARGPRILRFTSEAHRTRDQIEAELDFGEHLAAGGLLVACPVAARGGERVLDASDDLPRPTRTFATVFERLEGRHFAWRSPDVGRPLIALWGRTLARVHELSLGFRPHPARRRPLWSDDALAGCPLAGAPPLERALLDLRERLLGWLRGIAPDPAQHGLVHGDFERSNFLIGEGGIRLFDLDDCCVHWFAWDVACALWAFRNEPEDGRRRVLADFLDGYASVRAPDAERLARFSDLVRLRSLCLVVWRLRRRAGGGRDDWAEREGRALLAPWAWGEP